MGALESKKVKVEEVKQALEGNTLTLVVDYRGLTVAEIKELRDDLRKQDARLHVFKNTLIRRAIDGTEMEAMADVLKGPTALALTQGDQVQPVKVLKAFFKKYKKENIIRGGFMDGKALTPDTISQLSDLPSLDELRAKLVGALASPMNRLVAALVSPHRNLASVLDQVAKQKQQSESAG